MPELSVSSENNLERMRGREHSRREAKSAGEYFNHRGIDPGLLAQVAWHVGSPARFHRQVWIDLNNSTGSA